ncbi:nitroreductase family protein [candidate division KSB1 bacterium]
MARYFPTSSFSSGLDLKSLLKKRRSIRAFKNDPVSQDQIDTIISAGNHAPSGGNRHPWKYVVVRDEELKAEIRKSSEAGDEEWHKKADEKLRKWLEAKHITTEKQFLTDAPALIVVFGDSRDPYWLESVWISIGYMMLAAVDQGLGTVIYTPGDPDFLTSVLNISANYIPQVILPVGYPLVEPQDNPTRQTEMEHQKAIGRALSEQLVPEAEDLFMYDSENQTQERDRKCACGCGKKIVGLNSKRKYIHGHAKFGPNGLLQVLKNPPNCKCGCGEPTEWDWEKMNWKKYIDRHIGIHKTAERMSTLVREQIDLFK